MEGDAIACGDKLIVMGRGLRPSIGRTGPPASILVYADPKGSMPSALGKGNLRKDLERAGHRLRSVGTREELNAALNDPAVKSGFEKAGAVPIGRGLEAAKKFHADEIVKYRDIIGKAGISKIE